jgi:hypothetical protein
VVADKHFSIITISNVYDGVWHHLCSLKDKNLKGEKT